MRFKNYIHTKFPFFVALSMTLLLASCGSYQYVGYDSDGIYDNDAVVYEEATTVNVDDNRYYKDYFTEKDNQYNSIPDDGSAIFTDIDSYSSNYIEDPQESQQTGYAGWGQANENVTINFYDNGWNNWGWNAWGWNAGFGWGQPLGLWNRWNRPWGWNNWGWNAGFGWNNWGWNAGFGYNNFWCPPGFNGFFANSYYNGAGYAYNYGRRGANVSGLNRNASYSRNRASISRRNSSSVRSRSTFNSRRNNSSVRSTRSVRPRGNNSSVRPRSTRTRSNNSSARPRTRTNSNSSSRTRMSTPRRSSSPAVRSGGGSRSSGGSTRSSGGSSRGGSGRRG
ncbi:hypothetical protein SAMN04515667_1413 [Formosa sp. Hel1_31_208]|uniref:hypothetical protein n=1 Tax=Formosa sp. Hel1_31_208 TaxID=1798225 RepID=UPI00087937B0|nr:hypothetical protein [Formosa sp. Hel1_31_208]SDS10313.1 hypothetical protein SAMN04515667_1413 [Formosa sp. Hel1_31_208]